MRMGYETGDGDGEKNNLAITAPFKLWQARGSWQNMT